MWWRYHAIRLLHVMLTVMLTATRKCHNQKVPQPASHVKLWLNMHRGMNDTLLSFPKALTRSAHSEVYSNPLSALSTCCTYDLYFASPINSYSSNDVVVVVLLDIFITSPLVYHSMTTCLAANIRSLRIVHKIISKYIWFCDDNNLSWFSWIPMIRNKICGKLLSNLCLHQNIGCHLILK